MASPKTPENLSVSGTASFGPAAGLGCLWVGDAGATTTALWCGANTLANLTTSMTNGSIGNCTNCDTPASPGAVCTASGDHASAEVFRIRGALRCY
jgi:hypothetical protein